MPRHLAPLALALALLAPVKAFGQSGADLVPEDAAFAFTINSISGVRDKGEKFLKEHGLRLKRIKPSELFSLVFLFLGIKDGADEKGPAAAVVGSLKKVKAGEKAPQEVEKYFYIAVPVKDVGEMAGNYALAAADLKDGKAHAVSGGWFESNILLHGKHLYIGTRKEEVLALVPKSKPVTGLLTPAQKAALAKTDLAMHLGAEALGEMYGKALDQAEKDLRRKDRGDDAQSKLLIDALRELRFVVGGLDLDGRKINIIANFKQGKGGAASKKFLTALRAGPGNSDIVGLPEGRPLAVFAAKGDGKSNVAMARALVNLLFDQARIDGLLPGEERPAFVASLEKMYQELKGSRVALYHNQAARKGRLAVVGILDIGDTDKHLAEMPAVVKRLNEALVKAARGLDRRRPMVFSYEGKAEKVDGLEAHLLRVKSHDLPGRDREALVENFGPDWSKVRIVVAGKKVVFLAGSNLDLLKEAITNLKKGAKGLAEDRIITAELARLSKDRKVEIHVNLGGLKRLQSGMKPGPLTGMTSLALTVQPDHVQLEIVAAKSEVKPFATLFGLAE